MREREGGGERERETDRQTATERDRQRERQRQRNRQKKRETGRHSWTNTDRKKNEQVLCLLIAVQCINQRDRDCATVTLSSLHH